MSSRSRAFHRRAPNPALEEAAAQPAGSFSVVIRLYAWLADLAGSSRIALELPHGATAAAVVSEALERAGLDRRSGVTGAVRLTVNREYAPAALEIVPGDELALIPPIAGGAPAYVRITDRPLDLQHSYGRVQTAASESIVTFTGTTCGVELVHFEAYEEMAQARIEQFVADAMQSYRLEAISIDHRVGEVDGGEPSLIVAVAARRRSAAFSAACEVIDRIKSEAPIWKLEIDAGYRSWVRAAVADPPR